MQVLITGATGFVGGHLAEALQARGNVVLHGLSRRADCGNSAVTVQWHRGDLADRLGLVQLLDVVRPTWIVHLAGYAHAGRSFDERDLAWSGNLDGTRNLYEAIASSGQAPRVVYASTGLVYGDAGGPCSESTAMRPASPYAASKAAADLASSQYARHPGLDIVIARPFNHVGPRQSPDYAIARFASQIAAIERGEQPPVLETGDLEAIRDFTDVRDVVHAYLLLLEHGRRGEAYNVASGTGRRIGDVLEQLLSLSRQRIEVRSRPGLRPVERAAVQVNVSKLMAETGWRPAMSFSQTLSDTLDYWRRMTPVAERKDLVS